MTLFDLIKWCHQQESNLYLALRRHSFYPLNYGGGTCNGCEEWELYALAEKATAKPHQS